MGAQQSSALSPSSTSSSSTSSSSPLSLSPLPPSNMCEYSIKQIEKNRKEIEQLNISRDQRIRLHIDFKKQLEDANVALKRIPQTDNDIQFVANVGIFNDKNELLEDEKILQYPLIVKYILCCEVAYILIIYNKVLQKIVELCNKCKSERDVDNVDIDIDGIMDLFEEANRCFVLFSQKYKQGDIGDNYGTLLFNALVESTRTMHNMFKDKEEVKLKMREICKKREELKDSTAVLFNKGGKKISRSKRKFKSKKQKLSSRKKNKKVKIGKK